MKNKKQIVIATSVLVVITILLLGLTYAYYKTRINGNTKDKSISVTSKKLEITYADGNGVISPTEKIEPGYTVTKTFTVENTGDQTLSYSIKLDNITNTFSRAEDWTYVLKKGDVEVSSGKIPTNETYIVNAVSIDPKSTDNYTLTITYANLTDVDQSVDMGKSLSLRVNIDDAITIFENSSEGTLLKAIGKDNSISKPLTVPGAEISSEMEAVLSSTEDDYGASYYYRGNVKNNFVNFAGMCWKIVRILGDGSIRLILEDKDTTCQNSGDDVNWNIPTTPGGANKTGNFGYTEYAANTLTASDGTKNSDSIYVMDYLNGQTNSENSMATAFKNFQELTNGDAKSLKDKISTLYNAEIGNYLKSGDWCLDDKAYASTNDNATALTAQEILDNKIKKIPFYYDSYVRLVGKDVKEPTLKCNGTNMSKFGDNTDMYVGTLTADEITYAGAGSKIASDSILNSNYLTSNQMIMTWTLTSLKYDDYGTFGDFSFMFDIGSTNGFMSGFVNTPFAFRPSINLKSNVEITSGNGTQENPYKVQ